MTHTKHHLCVKNRKTGEICTNRCPERQTCNTPKTPLLTESVAILSSEYETEETHGIYITSLIPYGFSPEARESEIICTDSEN